MLLNKEAGKSHITFSPRSNLKFDKSMMCILLEYIYKWKTNLKNSHVYWFTYTHEQFTPVSFSKFKLFTSFCTVLVLSSPFEYIYIAYLISPLNTVRILTITNPWTHRMADVNYRTFRAQLERFNCQIWGLNMPVTCLLQKPGNWKIGYNNWFCFLVCQ